MPSTPTRIHIDAASWPGPLPHNWTYIGYDEINYTYVPEGVELLRKFGQEQRQPTYVRAITCFAPATVTPSTNGDPPTPISKMKTASPPTIGRSWI
ncbi:MAG: hypothetical protein R2856_29230 [Caldilineaceae bacterium]